MSSPTRQLLHQHIDNLPDSLIEQIADFTHFIMQKQNIKPTYVEWSKGEWEAFTLQQFFRDTDNDVTYSLEDAQEVFE